MEESDFDSMDNEHLDRLFEPDNEQDIEYRIDELETIIEDNEYWLINGGMSNPMKIKIRQRAIRDAKKELSELLNKTQ